MKKWFVFLTVVMLACLTFVGAPAIASNGIDANSQWSFTYCWDSFPCSNAIWYVTPPTFTDNLSNSGAVNLSQYPTVVCLEYNSGCYPAYCSQSLDFPAGTASGEMQGVDCHGTWSATRNCKNCAAPQPGPHSGPGPNGQ